MPGRQILIPAALVIMVLGVRPGSAAIPQGSGFVFQGQVKQNGVPVHGTCDFQFSLWDDPSANAPGNQLGATQTVSAVAVNSGLISVELNAAGEFGSNPFNGDARWLGIAVRCPAGNGAYTALAPRSKLSSVPYALKAFQSLGAGGSGPWSVNGSSVYYNGGKVAVGTANPGMSLEVTAPSYYGRPALGASQGSAYAYLHVTDTTDHSIIWDNGRGMRFGTEASRGTGYVELMRINADGNVGIGTSSPTSKLEVGSVATTGTAIRGLGTLGVYGEGGDAGVRGRGPATQGGGSIGVHGIANATSTNIFGITFFGGIGVKGESPSNIGVLGTSTASYGVKGESQNNDGVQGTSHHSARSGVWGNNDGGGYGVAGSSNGYAGVFGTSSTNGVYGQTSNGSASGVYGQNDGSGVGVGAYARGAPLGQSTIGGTGVEGISDGIGGYGVIGRAHGLNGVGVHAEAQVGNATALWAYNPQGRSALLDGYVDVYGAMNVAGTASVRTLTITGGADLAEPFEILLEIAPSASGESALCDEECTMTDAVRCAEDEAAAESGYVEPGMIVVIDPDRPGKLRVSAQAYDTRVAGVVSGANGVSPGMVMNAEGQALLGVGRPVALSGRVWCWCDASGGAITPGDLLTTSDTPGHAMKASDRERAYGAVIGKAMTGLEEGRRGLVLVLVSLQ